MIGFFEGDVGRHKSAPEHLTEGASPLCLLGEEKSQR